MNVLSTHSQRSLECRANFNASVRLFVLFVQLKEDLKDEDLPQIKDPLKKEDHCTTVGCLACYVEYYIHIESHTQISTK